MNNHDLLACFLEDQTIFNEENIVNNLIAFIFAGVETSHYAAQTITAILASKQRILEKARAEFDEQIRKPAIEEDASIASLSTADMLDKILSYENTSELEYASMIMLEAMRLQPPAPNSQVYHVMKDLTLGKCSFKKGDKLAINFQAIGHDPTLWQRPMEIIPERFDHQDPLFLTPDGKRRPNTALIPFHGGSRVCFGKTLAETDLKVFMSYMSEMFDMEFEDEKYMSELPLAQSMQSAQPPIWLKLTNRK